LAVQAEIIERNFLEKKLVAKRAKSKPEKNLTEANKGNKGSSFSLLPFVQS
jgi:hypothetical protein